LCHLLSCSFLIIVFDPSAGNTIRRRHKSTSPDTCPIITATT
jgi:hypothetical protein